MNRRWIALVLCLGALVCAAPAGSDTKEDAAFSELDQFCYDHGLFWGAEQFDVGEPWVVDMIWDRSADHSIPIAKRTVLWEESGYLDAQEAVTLLEQDYEKHPDGYRHKKE